MTGLLDTRSRPAEVPLGGYRWKQNFSISPDGKMCRRDGFDGWELLDTRSNTDFHHQGDTREAITMLFESTTGDGKRRLIAGTQSRLALLDSSAGTWSNLTAGLSLGATGTRWRAAELQDVILFTNNQDLVRYLEPTSMATVQNVTQLSSGSPGGVAVTAANVVASYNGFMIVMNLVKDGRRQSSTIHWSDLNLPLTWLPDDGHTGSLAGYQDLDYGDDILAAAPLLGALYIFTRRAIWRMMPSNDATSVFAFTKVYSEPKNQSGCLAFPNTLVSDGENLWYMGRDGIYRYNPYIPVPVRDDWLYRASGLIYRKLDTQIDDTYCLSPIAEYVPATREIWISWPDAAYGTNGNNNWTMVAQTEHHTADVVDHGFTAMVNFRLTPESVQKCNETQYFLAVSGTDWTIKSIGGVFHRELYTISTNADTGLPDRTIDLTDDDVLHTSGYYSILRGMVPLGLNDREKKLRKVLIDHDTSYADTYPVVQLRIGNAYSMVDPNDSEGLPLSGPVAGAGCAPQWMVIKSDGVNGVTNPPLKCPDLMTLKEMNEKGLRANVGMSWPMMQIGRFLFFEITVQAANGGAAIGGDSCLQRIDFDAAVQPKP